MCTLCGYTALDFWASFAIDPDGALSPPAVRARQASLLGRWAAMADQTVQAIQAVRTDPVLPCVAPRPLELDLADEAPQTPSSGLFSGAWIKAGVRGFTVSSPTGAMRFCTGLLPVVQQMRAQRPRLRGVLHCVWPQDYAAVDWAAFGAAWTWNTVMNDDHAALPPLLTLRDGRQIQIDPEPGSDTTLRVTLLDTARHPSEAAA